MDNQYQPQAPMQPVPQQPMQSQQKRGNPLGWASLILAVLGLISHALALILMWNYSYAYYVSEQRNPVEMQALWVIGYVLFGIGLILGIAGLFLKQRSKALAIWGIILNILLGSIVVLFAILQLVSYSISHA